MLSRLFILFVLLICFATTSKAQSMSDSLFYDQKFKRLQFQLDSLNRTSRFKNDTVEGLKQQTTIDSLSARLNKSEAEIRAIGHNLNKVHRQNRVANKLTVIGIGLALFSPLIMNNNYEEGLIIGISAGVLVAIVAPILRFDSNKFLKSAGK